MEVADWLTTLELDQYAAQFRDNDITGDLLPNLTADDLRDLGVTSIGHRRRLLDAIALLRKTNVDGLANAEQLLTESRETGPGERRQVTVLFADLTGYTELSKLLDAEEIEGILTAFFEVADTAIVEHGGIIDKHIGDCVMAVFGAPVAHGNDAERAVLAALRIRESVPMLCKRLGRDIGVHVGVASGEVLASQVGSARHKAYTVTGESVNRLAPDRSCPERRDPAVIGRLSWSAGSAGLRGCGRYRCEGIRLAGEGLAVAPNA
jgi:class 3 adenylate cyclase